jgi:hypothetical protein
VDETGHLGDGEHIDQVEEQLDEGGGTTGATSHLVGGEVHGRQHIEEAS